MMELATPEFRTASGRRRRPRTRKDDGQKSLFDAGPAEASKPSVPDCGWRVDHDRSWLWAELPDVVNPDFSRLHDTTDSHDVGCGDDPGTTDGLVDDAVMARGGAGANTKAKAVNMRGHCVGRTGPASPATSR